DGSLELNINGSITTDILIATMEALLIEGLEPPQNRKRGDGFSAVEFLQVPDPELEKRRREQLLRQLLKNLDTQ
ncbi:MAG: hypothetical protein NXI07_14855, partial [bacterium]|nr:hypothetical protein [bacterium]